MSYGSKNEQLKQLQDQVTELRKKILDVRKSQEPEKVKNYELTLSTGEKARLSELFGDKKELFVIHNMGKKCVYCTLWADGFNGLVSHLESRAAFVLSSPDSPQTQTEFAASRGWKFRMASTQGTSFTKDLGYQGDDWLRPGVSVFIRSGEDVLRVSDTEFGPGDDYCQLWHLFDLMPEGVAGWSPKYTYSGGK
jgi:predicted dithiol-disulfide oxidoreductase (DUF899 family)